MHIGIGFRWIGMLVLFAACHATRAQSNASTEPDSGEPVVAVSDIALRADDDEQFAESVQRRASAAPSAESFDQRLKALSAARTRLQDTLRKVRIEALPIRRLESLERHWHFLARDLDRWHKELQAAIKPLSADAEQLTGRRRVWATTLSNLTQGETPWSTRARQVIAGLADAERTLAKPGSALLKLSQSAVAIDSDIAAGLEQAQRQIHLRDRALWQLDAAPLWTEFGKPPAKTSAAGTANQGFAIELGFANDYDTRFARSHHAMTLAMLVLLPLLVWVSRRTRARARRGHVAEGTLAVLSRPFAAWIVLYAIASLLFHWDGPVIRQQITLLVAWLPVLRLLPAIMRRALGPWAWISAVFYALNFAASLFAAEPLRFRLALAALAAALVSTLLWLAHRHLRRVEASPARTRTLWLLIGSAVLAAAALIANLVGNVALATVLLDGLLDATYIALALSAVAAVAAALSDVLLHRGAEVMPAHMGARAGSLRRAAMTLGGLFLALVWLLVSLNSFRVLRPTYEAVKSLLGVHFVIGDFDIGIGNIVLFVFGVTIAWWIARTLRSLLAEDVLPSMALPRGVAHSVSTLSYYALIGTGVLVALALSGFQLSQLAIVFGALGVGIGLGLQDVVKNFVSGLILMIERPIQPGDVIELAGVTGRVREIGLRATRLVTFDGADVVIPNGMLVADRVTNWTLSNSSRRIEVNVGVAYSSDPQQVLSLLRGVAARTEGLLPEPSPTALFVGFGQSSLDFSLRAWTREDSDWVSIRSSMGLSALAALRDAGIDIPFPQQDMHLRSLSPEAAALLAQSAASHRTESPET